VLNGAPEFLGEERSPLNRHLGRDVPDEVNSVVMKAAISRDWNREEFHAQIVGEVAVLFVLPTTTTTKKKRSHVSGRPGRKKINP